MCSNEIYPIIGQKFETLCPCTRHSAKNQPSFQERREITHSLVKYLLPEISDLEVHRLATGQPVLVSTDLSRQLPHISISHSGPWIGCVVSDPEDPIGLDLEDMSKNRSYKQIALYAFSDHENQYINKTGVEGFYRLWTAKEAIAKLQGKGLNTVLNTDLDLQLVDTLLEHPFIVRIGDEKYELTQKLIDGHVMCAFARVIRT